ncbi:hypothetical protein BHE89_03525 [Shigella sp. FC1967]|uniref:hypothetical protein n=1 Tax=Shigella sp. FC1967 TaxID=1898041 RepID=UPI0008682EF4|nr:hypothetical protein [Shigella sp. FC1967]OEJ07857.1 hypothetical protein BHE89_03525 [Shigella sp. FC1967]
MFNTQALYAWIALLAFSLGWIAQGWHRDNIALEQRMLITAIEDQANMDACLDLQFFPSDCCLEHVSEIKSFFLLLDYQTRSRNRKKQILKLIVLMPILLRYLITHDAKSGSPILSKAPLFNDYA